MTVENIDLNLLHCLFWVGSERSISKAGKKLHLSQPAVSLQLKKLEQQVGGQLVQRRKQGMILTPLGSKVFSHAVKIIEAEKDLLKTLDKTSKSEVGKVRIGSYTTITSYLLCPSLKKFLEKNQGIEVSFHYPETREIVSAIRNFDLDCAVVSDIPNSKDIVVEPVATDEMILVARRDFKVPKSIVPKQLRDYPFISYPIRDDYCYAAVEKQFGRYLKSSRLAVESQSFDTIKQAALAGIGLTFIPKYLVRSELKDGSLKSIGMNIPVIPIRFNLVTPKNGPVSNPTKLVCDHIRESIAIYE